MFNPLSILLHVVNAAILIGALYWLLYKPVRKFMNKRATGIAKDLQDVADAQEKLRDEQKSAHEEIEAVRKDAASKAAKSVAQAQEQAQHILEDAHKDAELTLKQARMEAEYMRRNARDKMRDEVADLSVQLAGKILQREVNQADHAKLVEDFLKKVE
ncbi:MAG: F0F1 ATP synthase subunit B [Eubacteriales bacterium]|nr:F0F1 ATP synthase subunit B [Eubacteriales bacterium]